MRRKLEALGHPHCATLSANLPLQEPEFRALVAWLEDEKIRHYPEAQRDGLRNLEDPAWSKNLVKYLRDLGLEEGLGGWERTELAEILLSVAISLEYGDEKNPEKYGAVSAERLALQKKEQAPQIVATNPFDTLDFSSPEFVKGVNDLADMLKVGKHPNHLLTLEACATLVKSRYSKEAIKNGDNLRRQGDVFPFQEVDKSFKGNDPVLTQAAKILRLLFITDLRDLQTQINECIVAVQSVTANPKTDIRLGKVGY